MKPVTLLVGIEGECHEFQEKRASAKGTPTRQNFPRIRPVNQRKETERQLRDNKLQAMRKLLRNNAVHS
jgi:hypothetical protein